MNISDDYKHLLIKHLNKYFRNCKLTGTEELGKYLYSINGSYRYCVLSLRAYMNFLIEADTIEQEVLFPYLRISKNVKKSQPENYIPTDNEIGKSYEKIEDARVGLYYTILAYSGIRILNYTSCFQNLKLND